MSRCESERERTIEEGRRLIESVLTRCTLFKVEWRNPDAPQYQLAKIDGVGFSMIAYPHKTSAGNHHIRLRDNGSKDKLAYRHAVEEFYVASGNNCSFQTKNANETISQEAFMAAATSREVR